MKRADFLAALEDALAVPAGTFAPDKALKAIRQWDSLAIVEFQALMDEKLGVQVQPQAIAACVTVADLLALAPGKLEA